MHKMNKILERSLRLLLKNYKDDFQHLLRSSVDISIHQRCINSLLTEVYKYIHGFSPKIINEVFYKFYIYALSQGGMGFERTNAHFLTTEPLSR